MDLRRNCSLECAENDDPVVSECGMRSSGSRNTVRDASTANDVPQVWMADFHSVR